MYNTFHFRVSDVQPLTTKVLDDEGDGRQASRQLSDASTPSGGEHRQSFLTWKKLE